MAGNILPISCAFFEDDGDLVRGCPDEWHSLDRAASALAQIDRPPAGPSSSYSTAFNCILAVLVSTALKGVLAVPDAELDAETRPVIVVRAVVGWMGTPKRTDFGSSIFGVACFGREAQPSDVLAAAATGDGDGDGDGDGTGIDYSAEIDARFARANPAGPRPVGKWFCILLRCERHGVDVHLGT